ncbi:hypothetical protein QZH41_006141, partial [Actinostola sp. cb2023]
NMEPPNWQTELSTVRQRNEYAFNKSLFCDVKFSVVDANGDKVTIPANKYILAISSPVFEAMFYGKLAETKPTIDLPDCTKEGLHELMRYMYSDEVNLSGSNVLEVLYLAEKYMIPFLVEKCKQHLQNEVGPDDVLSVLPQVQKIGDENLLKHFWDIVDKETPRAVSSEPFLNVSREMLCQILFSVVDVNGDKVTIPANKYILAISSPVFEAMFYGKLAETKPTIDLPDCTKEGLHELMRYMYSDEVNLSGTNVMEVLYLAEKYMMPFLVEKCKQHLQNEVGPDDVLSVLPQVQKIGDENLLKHFWDIVDKETPRAVSSEPFLNVSREMLCQILVRDTLKVKELEIFQAVDKWVTKRIEEKGLHKMEPPNWQTELSTVRQRNEYAFNKSLFCDVKFSVVDANGDKVTIPANKYILAISSPVFEAMFYGKLAETKPTIDLPDCTKEGLHELMRYMYSDEVNLSGSNVLEVLYLAEKYMMPFLVEKCKQHLQNEVGPDDVLSILPQVQKIGDENLLKHFWDIVDKETPRAVSSEPFLNVSREMLCQILFSVVDVNGDKVTIPANKYILAISSPVFEAMFYGQLAETKPTIDLPDCTKEGLHELMRYMYSDEVNLSGSNVLEVLYLAEKYMMPFLVEKCKQHLQNEVGPDDVLSVLPQVQKIGDENLLKHFWDIVDKETPRAVSSEPFLNVSREMLCQILVRDTLKVKELEIFQAVDKWVTKRIEEKGLQSVVCNGETKRAILGEEVIRLIRFPLMTQKEFAEVVLPCKILEIDELTELFQIFNRISLSTHTFIEKKRQRNEYAFNKSLFCDVKFSVVDANGDKVTIPANKYILAISSPVFEAMFYGKLAETKPTIDLPDCTKEGLHELMRYVYSDEVNLTASNVVVELLYLAEKYMMPFLVEKCKQHLQNEVGPDDVLSILPQVQKIGDENLLKHFWDIVDKETPRAVSSEPFLNVSREMLCQILVRDTLEVTEELEIFQAVDKWVTKRIEEKGFQSVVCNGEAKRAILGEEVIRLIRFPLMTQKEFLEVVLPSEILEKDEMTELQRNEYAFNKSLFCDVKFSVVDVNGDKVTIPANKYILAISSPVFEAMFYGQLAETKPTIDLPDCTKEGLHELMRYMYSDEVNLSGSNVLELLYLAEKYMMPFLVEKCKQHLQNEVGPDDVLSVLPQVQKIGDENLLKHFWDIVDKETPRAVSSEPFLNVSREMLCQILVRDTLKVKELEIFQAVDKWVTKRIKR